VPRVETPSRNVTVPVGVPVAGGTGLTVAVNVTPWPNTDGSSELDTVVVVAGSVTVCVIAAEVFELKLVSPA
jgi:hypothetical protein